MPSFANLSTEVIVGGLVLLVFFLFLLEWFIFRVLRLTKGRRLPYRCLRGDCRNGFSVTEFDNGNRYEGEYLDGKKHGEGTFTWTDGRRYTGKWRAGRMHGAGLMQYPLGGHYRGNFVEDRREGKGVYTWPNKAVYEGEFVNNKRHGYGIYYGQDGKILRGTWREDKLIKRGAQE